ncbi:MAG: hypothetical protein ACOVLC_10605 [Flavobacterium sp.]
MGLSFHYKGKLKKASNLNALIEEVKDIATANHWSYFLLEDKYDNNKFQKKVTKHLYGITVSAPKCEPFYLSFLSNGQLYDVFNFTNLDFSQEIDVAPNFYISTKTALGAPEIHIQLIHLLDYIANKYLTDFDCIDDGHYWESSDVDVIKERFDHFTNLMDSDENTFKPATLKEIDSATDNLKSTSEETSELPDEEAFDLPALSLEEEIEFKKMKLSLEKDAIFPKTDAQIPPEIENQFLDYVIDFDRQFENAQRITVFEKLGRPYFRPSDSLSDDEIEREIERLYRLMETHGLTLDVICDYEDENRLIYAFITKELFHEEIDDIKIPGMMNIFIYEEFYPNEAHEIEKACLDFVSMFLNKKSSFYKEYHFKDAENHLEINAFRKLFKSFKTLFYNFDSYTVSENQATAHFSIEFTGKMKKLSEKVFFKGAGQIKLIKEYGYWYVKNLQLPV